MFNNRQRERYFSLLQNGPVTLESQVRLAEMYQGRKMFNAARQSLLRAVVMLWATRDQSDYKQRLKNVAKKLGDEKLVDTEPDRELILEAGFIEITKETEPFEVETGPDEPVVLFSRDSEGRLSILTLNCKPKEDSDNPLNPFELYYTHRKGGSTGWGTRGGYYGNNTWEIYYVVPDFLDNLNLRCRINTDQNRRKYFMSFELTQPKQANVTAQ
jgi:hypothetical protein